MRDLPEMSHKISFKTYHFLPKFWNLPDLHEKFSCTFFINLLRIESWFFSFHEGYEWNNRCAHCMAAIQKCAHRLFHSYPSWNDQNQLSVLIIINFCIIKFQIKLALSVVMYAILAFFNYLVACKDLERNSKELLLTDHSNNRHWKRFLDRENCSRK